MAGLDIASLTDGITVTQLSGFLLGEVLTSPEINTKPYLTPPDLTSVMGFFKRSIMADINKVSIGIIKGFDSSNQTASIQLVYKRVIGDQFMDYPLLVNAPCVHFQSGGGNHRITNPVAQGDMAIVLFCDRDIDNWFSGSNSAPPNSERMHDLSDGIAIVGLGRGMPNFNVAGPEMRSGNCGVRVSPSGVTIANNIFSLGMELALMWAAIGLIFVEQKATKVAVAAAHTTAAAVTTAMAADTGLNSTTRAAATTATPIHVAATNANTAEGVVIDAQYAIMVEKAANMASFMGTGVMPALP